MGRTTREGRKTQLRTRRGRRNPQRWAWRRERDGIQVSCNAQRHRTAYGELRDGSRPPPRQDSGKGSEEGDAVGRWEQPPARRGKHRLCSVEAHVLRYGRFNPQLVNPAKHLIQLHTPECSRGITHIYNRESTCFERRWLNCNLTEINFCARLTRYYHKLPTEDYTSDLKTIFNSQLKILIIFALYSQHLCLTED